MYRDCEIVQRVGLENGLLSESFIFEVRDQSGETIAYMKTLPPRRNPESRLRDEAAGLAFCNSLRLHRVSSPQAYFSKSPPLLWITKAPGQTIGSIITDYDRGLVSAERIYQALFAVGNFLQKLHTRFPQPFDGKAREMLEAYIAHHEEILRVADPLELREQSVQDAIEIFRSESDHLRNVGVRCALLHGDANCGNFLWEPQTQLLSVIDLQRLGTQIRTGGRGFAAFEYRSLLNVLGYYPNIGFLGVRGGLELARDAFKTGYGEIDQHEDRFFTSIRYIRRALAGNQRVHEITRPPVPI
jgi:aminoglycoside phosphotransferase